MLVRIALLTVSATRISSSPFRPLTKMDVTSDVLNRRTEPFTTTRMREEKSLESTVITSAPDVPLIWSWPLTRPTESSRRDSSCSTKRLTAAEIWERAFICVSFTDDKTDDAAALLVSVLFGSSDYNSIVENRGAL